MRFAWIMVSAMLISVACAGGSGVKFPDEAAATSNMSARRYAMLTRLASKQIQCPKEDLTYTYLEDNRHALSGCGGSAEFILICIGTQCRWTPPPLAQASFDLDCPIESLELIPIHDQKVGIKGCGRRSSYAWICQSVLSCDWYSDAIDGARSQAAVAAEKASRTRALEASNQAERQIRSFENSRRLSTNQSTLQSGVAAAAAAGGGR